LPVNLSAAYPAGVAVAFCPACREPLHEPGALRCRACGADARGAPAEVGVSVRLDRILSPETLEALDRFGELQEAAPTVAEWYRTATDAERKVVELLLAELRRLRRPGP
jgi:hypothetical protein